MREILHCIPIGIATIVCGWAVGYGVVYLCTKWRILKIIMLGLFVASVGLLACAAVGTIVCDVLKR